MKIDSHGTVPQKIVEQLEREVANLTTFHRVLEWAKDRATAFEVDDIVTQDEFTHDVVMRSVAPYYLVWDIT